MNVSDSTQLATSATLGGSAAIDFGITDDPAFFQILSANLYSNQKLAVVRETLCNLWDAHIDAGITHIPGFVRITADNKLIFRDYGKGIAPENMGAVYGTYGASTKKNDSRSTGGFGLGCKSPFAYTDSFRVTSHHNGVKTVYNVTKSSVETNGKPGIIQIMQAPTDETGLEVSIPIEEDDHYEFIQYIRYIVKHGEMKMRLKVEGYYSNSTTDHMPVMGMSKEVGAYSFNSHDWYDDYMGDHSVFIRYGGVVYPALDTPATRAALETIKRFMRIIDVDRIMVQAAPDTLALTPSREALSSQKMTENGVVDLCLKLTERVEKDIRASIPADAKRVAERITSLSIHQLDTTEWIHWVRSMPSLSQRYVMSSLGKCFRKHYKSMMRNAEMEVYRKAFKGHKFQKQILKAVYAAKESKNELSYRKLFWQFVAKPVLKMMKHKDLNIGSFRSMQYAPYRNMKARNHHIYHKEMDLRAMAYSMAKPTVFVTTRLRDIDITCGAWPGFADRTGNRNYFVYHIGKKKDENLAPIAAFESRNWTVVDITQNHEWDPVIKTRKIRDANKKPAKPKVSNGLIPLSNICEPIKTGFVFVKSLVKDKSEWEGETDAPLFYVDYADVTTTKLGRYCTNKMVTDDMLKNAVVVRTGVERNMAIKRGAVSVDQFFVKPMLEIYLGKEMKDYLTRRRAPDLSNVHEIKAPVLRLLEALEITVPGLKKVWYRSDLEEVLKVIEKDSLYRLHVDEVITDDEYDRAIVVSKYSLQEFSWIKQIKAVMRDPIIEAIDMEEMRASLVKRPERKAAFRSLVLIAMKNGTKK